MNNWKEEVLKIKESENFDLENFNGEENDVLRLPYESGYQYEFMKGNIPLCKFNRGDKIHFKLWDPYKLFEITGIVYDVYKMEDYGIYAISIINSNTGERTKINFSDIVDLEVID